MSFGFKHMSILIILLLIASPLVIVKTLVTLFRKGHARRITIGWVSGSIAIIILISIYFIPVHITWGYRSNGTSAVLLSADKEPQEITGTNLDNLLEALSSTKFRRELYEASGLNGEEVYYHVVVHTEEGPINLQLYIYQDGTETLVRIPTNPILRATNPSMLTSWLREVEATESHEDG